MIPHFETVKLDDGPLARLQDRVRKVLDVVTKKPALDHLIVENVALSSGANRVSHGLGRPLLGWTICRLRGAATVYDQQDTNKSPELFLDLQASAPVLADFLVW